MSINKLILGTVQMGLPYGINNLEGQISLENSFNILKTARNSGLEFLDTAEAYGSAHDIIGKYHQTFPGYCFKVITKLPHKIDSNIPSKIEEYLIDLKMESLYALLFHSYSSYKKNIAYIDLLNKFKSQGIIKKIGVSVYNNEEIEEVINDNNIDIIQFPYNIFDNYNLRGELLRKAKENGKIVHTRSCFLQGLFFTPKNTNNKVAKLLDNELGKIREISEEYNMSIERIALNYCLQERLIDNVIIGVDNINQFNENFEDSKLTIHESIIKKINSIKIKNLKLLNPSLWSDL